MCVKLVNTHTHSSLARQDKKYSLENNVLHTFFFFVQGMVSPLLFTFNPYHHAYVRI